MLLLWVFAVAKIKDRFVTQHRSYPRFVFICLTITWCNGTIEQVTEFSKKKKKNLEKKKKKEEEEKRLPVWFGIDLVGKG